MELNFLGHEAVRQMVSAIQGYKPDGQPMWLLRTVRTISVQYMRALGVSYPGMPEVEKLNLCRLMIYEALQRAWRACESDAKKTLFRHQIDLMRQHEIIENSTLGQKLMTDDSSQISVQTLNQTYAEQGRFKKQKKQNKKTTQKTKKTKKDASRCLLRLPALKASLRLYT